MKIYAHTLLNGLTFCIIALAILPVQADAIEVGFVARLANFDGIIPSLWSKVALDKERSEVFTLNPRQRDIRVFDRNGMETFGFGDDVELAGATDLDLGEEGNIYLVYPRGREHKILRLDYKGEPLAAINLQDLPADFESFEPHFIQFMGGNLYLADIGTLDAVQTDINGVFKKGYHLKDALLTLEEELKDEPGGDTLTDPQQFKSIEMFGFCAGLDGSLYFTVPTLFAAFKYNGDGEIEVFGSSGSGPGKFGVVAGITTDKKGNIYISDRLRSVVMIFNSSFEFQNEFGYRGSRPGNLIVPDDVAVDDESGFIYVAQAANRGVNVYRINDF